MRAVRLGSGGGSGDCQRSQPVERFRPTTGAVVGWVGIVMATLTGGWLLVADPGMSSLRIALGLMLAGVLVWATQLRPRVTAYPAHLRLHGPLSDTYVPYVAVNQVALGQTLSVYVGRKRYVCVGIGRPLGAEMRQRVRSRGSGSLFGPYRVTDFGLREVGEVRDPGGTYAAYVLERIERLVAAARSELDRSGGLPDEAFEVRRRPAAPELAALVGIGAALLASLLI